MNTQGFYGNTPSRSNLSKNQAQLREYDQTHPTVAIFRGDLFNSALAQLFPLTDTRAQFAGAFDANLQHFNLWDLEDETSAARIRGRLLDVVVLANGIRTQVISFRLASMMVPAVAAVRTPEVDITLDALQTLAERLSGVAREMIAGDDLSPETLLARSNSLDGTLENLKIEAQFFQIQIQKNAPLAN